MAGRIEVESRKARAAASLSSARSRRPSPQLTDARMNAERPPPKLLIVEDDEGLQRQLRWAYDDYEVFVASTREAASTCSLGRAAVVTLDLGLPPDPDGVAEGFATLEAILSLKPDTKVIVASGHGARESALRAISSGAYDFYQKPVDIDQLGLIVRRAFQLHEIENENRRLEERGGGDRTVLGTMIAAAPEMLKVARTIERVANADVSVMLLGASGTGKELLARGLHQSSGRRGGAFVAINCAAIPENLLEAELFGSEKGAFTGAIKTTEGKIELAHGGTLFLDEVGDIPLPLQVKLLRFLQERTIERIGGRKPIPVDTRIVCATHQDLPR
jgi:two-component system NtrC family response regulator